MRNALTREELVGDFPAIWEFYPTMACNLKCTYCYHSLKESENPFKDRINSQFSPEELSTFFERYVRDGDMISFIGGEPFVALPWLSKLFDFIDSKKLSLRYNAFTNGTLLPKVPVSMLKRFTYLTVSVDGDEETTDQYRGEGTFQSALSGIKYVRKLGIPTIGRITVMPDNNLYSSVMTLTPEVDVVYWQHGNRIELDEFDENAMWGHLERLLESWFKKLYEGQVLALYPFLSVISHLLLKSQGKTAPYPPAHAIGCGAGCNYFQVLTDGNFYVCPELIDESQAKMGSLSDGFTRRLDSRDFENTSKCSKCYAHGACHTRCIHFNPEEYCRLIRKVVSYIEERLDQVQKLVNSGVIPISALLVKQHYSDPSAYDGPLQAHAELELMF